MRKRNIKSIAHWCIMGVLLLFPVLMVGVSAFANDEQTTTVTESYEYQTNEVTSASDLVDGNIYHFSTVDNTIGDTIYDYIDSGTSFTFDAVVFNVVFDTLPGSEWYSDETIAQPYFYIYSAGSSYTYSFPFAELSDGNHQIMCLDNYAEAIQFEFDFIYHYPPDMVNILCSNGYIYASDYLGELTTTVDIQNSSYKQEVNNWANGFKNLEVNGWYKQLLNVIGIGETTNSVMNVIYVYPLYVLWVYILDLIVDCLLLIVRFGHDALQRLGADNE